MGADESEHLEHAVITSVAQARNIDWTFAKIPANTELPEARAMLRWNAMSASCAARSR